MDTKNLAVVGLLSITLFMGCPNNQLVDINDCTLEARGGQRESCSSDGGRPGIGSCKSGFYACSNGVKDRSKCLEEVMPSAEICDGIDNNCDGNADIGIESKNDPRIGLVCGQDQTPPSKIGVGPCKLGKTACTNGTPTCIGAVAPKDEECDGVDNDCNGRVDDSVSLFNLCWDGNPRAGIGQCRPGTRQCTNGSMDAGVCENQVFPSAEVCDGKDHDCDGESGNGCSLSIICPPDAIVTAGNPVTWKVVAQSSANITGYSWKVVSAPIGGIGTPNQWSPDPPTLDLERFLAYAVGAYTIRVTVSDSSGKTAACETHLTTKGYSLRVELTWNGIGDLDLHLHNGSQTPWFTQGTTHPSDCYFNDLNPDWDVPGVLADNPLLDTDDVAAFGPENTRIETPVSGESYTIGVHNYKSGMGRIATVRIYCGNAILPTAVYVSRPLDGTAKGACTVNDFWKVANVAFAPSGACFITGIDTYSSSTDRCISF